jgi:Spy/CpxP family protein refolding chaperone
MIRLQHRVFIAVGSLALLLAVADTASAQQGRRGRGFGTVSEAQLATLDQVQTELKLTAEQKSKLTDVDEKLSSQRRELFQDSNQDNRDERREQYAKAVSEATTQVRAALDENQKKRLRELWIQVNGAAVLDDEEVAKELKITDDQKRELEQVADANREAAREAFQGLGELSQEQRTEKFNQLRRESEQRTLGVLTPEQREQFEKLQGKKVEIDRSQLFRRRRDT